MSEGCVFDGAWKKSRMGIYREDNLLKSSQRLQEQVSVFIFKIGALLDPVEMNICVESSRLYGKMILNRRTCIYLVYLESYCDFGASYTICKTVSSFLMSVI